LALDLRLWEEAPCSRPHSSNRQHLPVQAKVADQGRPSSACA
jgi:hypothetical protein